MQRLVSPASSGIVADTATVEAGLCERPAGEDVPTDPTGSKTESNCTVTVLCMASCGMQAPWPGCELGTHRCRPGEAKTLQSASQFNTMLQVPTLFHI